MSAKSRWSKAIVMLLILVLLLMPLPTAQAQSVSGAQVAEAVAAQLPARSSVVLLPVSNNRLDLSGENAFYRGRRRRRPGSTLSAGR
jgi:hypothetical protein